MSLKSRVINLSFLAIMASQFVNHELKSQIYVPRAKKLIKHLKINKNRITIVANDEFKKRFLRKDFFAEYASDIDLTKIDKSLVTLPFILNVITLVWHSGKKYYVDYLDKDFYLSLKKTKKLLQKMYPKVRWDGELIPKHIKKNKIVKLSNLNNNIALLFTGGVDSTFSALKHRDKSQLLITICNKQPEYYSQASKDVRSFAQNYGHKNSFIVSNFQHFLNLSYIDQLAEEIPSWRTGAIEDLGWIGLCAPILITKKIPILYIGSTFTWDYKYPTLANPIIDQILKYANIKAIHDDFYTSRAEKVNYILNLHKAGLVNNLNLKVCEGLKNCNTCEKCLRTLNNIISNNGDYNQFGFRTKDEDVMKNTSELIKKPLRQALVFFYKDCQNQFKKLITKKGAKENRVAYANWFLNINFDHCLTKKEKDRQVIDWLKLSKELHIEIPKKEILELNR